MGFASCEAAGKGNGGYAGVYTQSFWSMSAGHNCTNYVAFRLQTNGVGKFTVSGQGNAENWGAAARNAGIAVDRSNPRPGDVAWFDAAAVGGVGHVAYVESVDTGAGTVLVSEDNWGGDFDWRSYRISDVTGFIHVSKGATWPPAEGSFVNVAESGAVFRIAGGAPVFVASWAAVGGAQPVQTISEAQLAQLPAVPADGTLISATSGGVYVIAHGAPLHVSNWAAIGGSRPTIQVDDEAINHAGEPGVWSHLRSAPADGFIVGFESGRVFRVVGGHAYYVSTWDPYGGAQPTVTVDDWAIDNCNHLNCEPFGNVDSASGAAGRVHVSGWAMDPGPEAGVDVHVYVDGQMAGAAKANQSRLDVDGAFHRGADYGFSASFPAAPGQHSVCVYAINTGTGAGNPLLGCKDVTATAASVYTTAPAPTVTGTLKVGSKVAANVGTWSPKPDSFTYQWYRDGVKISGAASSQYTLAVADAGHQVSVVATAKKTGFANAAKASARVNVPLLSFTTAPKPTVTGTLKAGSTVEASVGAWSPAPTSFAYQWYRDGVKISGAASSQYTLAPADAGHQVSVMATAKKAGYTSVGKASARVSVPWLKFTTTPTPTITGIAKAGNKVTASVGSWSPKPDAFTYRWYRDGVAISGAVYYQYTLTTADAGRQISVAATAKKTGYTSVGKASARVSVPWLKFATTPTPTITGIAKAGNKVTASVGSWSPKPDAFTYRWYRDGVAISGAVYYQYTLTTADAGRQISVVATAKKTGYRQLAKASPRVTVTVPPEKPYEANGG